MNDEIKEINIKRPGQILDYVDTKEHLLELYNYITNLQQENEKLLSENITIKSVRNMVDETIYKSRIEKAVEYLDRHKIELSHSFDEPDCDYWIATNPQDIIDILNGRSDE